MNRQQTQTRLPTIFGAPTRAAIARSLTLDETTGLMMSKNPSPRHIGHGQQLAGLRLGYDPTQPEPATRWKKRMPASNRVRPRKSRGPKGFDFSKCHPDRHLGSSPAKRQWRATRDAARASERAA